MNKKQGSSRLKNKNLTRNKVEPILFFLDSAYADYLAARTLLCNGLLVQGCILANTALEKYLKSVVALKGDTVPQTHSICSKSILNPIKNYTPYIYEKLNIEFLEFLTMSYKLRYKDSLPIGYNLLISQNKTLSELDYLAVNFRNILPLFISIKLPYKILGNYLDTRTILYRSINSLEDLLQGHNTVEEMWQFNAESHNLTFFLPDGCTLCVKTQCNYLCIIS